MGESVREREWGESGRLRGERGGGGRGKRKES